jgi:hypothetical protein
MAYRDQQQKKMSFSFATFFSSERKGNEFQLVKLGFYDGKLTFNFLKGTSGGGSAEGGEAYTSLEYETACLLKNFVDNLVRSRVGRLRSGLPYEDIYVTYNISFQDKESHETRSAGNITFKTSSTPESGNNTVHLLYSNGTNNYDIALGNNFLQKSFTHTEEQFTDIDSGDARFYALAYLLNNIIRNWPSLVQNDRIASVTMNRINSFQDNYLNAIMNKLGIPLPENNSGGKYQDKYRSKGGGESHSRDSQTSGNWDNQAGGSDEPF